MIYVDFVENATLYMYMNQNNIIIILYSHDCAGEENQAGGGVRSVPDTAPA